MFDHFDLLAPIYDRCIRKLDLDRLQALLKLPGTGRMLDAGGGTGRVSAHFRGQVDVLVVSDLSRPMLQQARAKHNLNPVQTHVEQLPFPRESFERILIVDALHHFCSQQDALAELARILHAGGRLVIEEPDIERWPVKLLALAEKLMGMRSRFYKAAEIAAMLKGLGLATRVEDDGQLICWVVADKRPQEKSD